jgi:hypothetical protein
MSDVCPVYLRFDQRSKQLSSAAAEMSAEQRSIGQAIAAKTAQLASLKETRQKVLDSGVATGDVDRALEIAQLESDALRAKAADLIHRSEEVAKEQAALEPSLWLLRMAQEIWGIKSVPTATSLQELYSAAKVQILCVDGCVTKVAIEICTSRGRISVLSAELDIRSNAGRYLSSAVPEELSWLPSQVTGRKDACLVDRWSNAGSWWECVAGGRSGEVPMVCYLESEERLLPALPDVNWQVRNANRRTHYGSDQPEWIPQSRCIGADLPSLSQLIATEINGTTELNLDAEFRTGTLLGYVRELVLQATVAADDYRFTKNAERLHSAEILARLQPHWGGFVNGPWQKSMTGLLANLKYYCENGEMPRFFGLEYRNSFGFRLRTRDHSWIVGRVYLLPDGQWDSARSSDTFELWSQGDSEQITFSIGPLSVHIEGEERLPR